MQVKLEKTHQIDAPSDQAWNVLKNINIVAECMPGTSITERVSDDQYKGVVKLRVGPVQAVFNGTIDIIGIDESNRSITLSANGRDTRGNSTASMHLTASVAPIEGGGCELVGSSQIKIAGKMASFGARMINQISDQMIRQFLENFSNRVVAEGEGSAAEEAADRVAEQPKELNALALVWSVIVSFFRRLFGRRGGVGRRGSRRQ